MDTIGFLELNSIAKGIEATDIMLKTAEVNLVFSKPGCPGKYYIFISGDVSAVQASINAGEKTGGVNVIESIVIPRIHPQVIRAINTATTIREYNAIGIMEFLSVTASILAADAAVKTAEVELIEVRLGTGIGGKSFVVISGEVAAVREGIERGTNASDSGLLLEKVVIPSPKAELFENLL